MEENLQELIKSYFSDKYELDLYKKSTDEYNKKIKEAFNALEINEFETDTGLIAKLIVQKRESFDEENLLKELIQSNHSDLIDLVPTINWEKVEDAIYNERLDASILNPYKKIKEIEVLKVTEKKDK